MSALIPEPAPVSNAAPADVEINRLTPNEYQPRAKMDDGRLQELADSIKANGVIQPIIVRQVGDAYQIIAGERRWRAAQKAGLAKVPVIVRAVSDDQQRSVLEVALIENIQREDLNPLDEALAYRRLADEFHLKQEDIAAAVGKDRATVANHLRLLKLPPEVQAEVQAGTLSMGHARALLALPSDGEQRRVGREVIGRALSVRETESVVKRIVEARVQPPEQAPPKPVDVHTRAAEERLRVTLGTKVRIVRRGTRGRIEIDFVSEDELIRLYDQLTDRLA